MWRFRSILLVAILALRAGSVVGTPDSLVPTAWRAQGEAETLAGEVVLKGPGGVAVQDVSLGGIAGKRYLCTAEMRSDGADVPASLCLSLSRPGAPVEIRLFEHARLQGEWTRCTEDVVFPPDVGSITGLRLERGAGAGSVHVRNVALTAEILRFDHRARPLVPLPPQWGPTRAPAPGTAELLYRSGRAAVSADLPVPIIFACRSGLPPRTMATLVFDLPRSLGRPYALSIGHPATHEGEPRHRGEVTHQGVAYDRYTLPTCLYYKEQASQCFLLLKSSLPAGRPARMGYFLEWEGGNQPERWLEVDTVSIPAGPAPRRFVVAMDIGPFYWEMRKAPGFSDLLRRVGLGGVELSDIAGPDARRTPTFDYFRQQGFQLIGIFDPGWWYPYCNGLLKDEEMQAKGMDGRPVPTDHGPAACPSYRGPLYRKQMEHLAGYVACGIERFAFDEEFFGPGGRICFCARCKALFRATLEKHLPGSTALSLEEIAGRPAAHPEAARLWAQFKADLMTEWYRDYRKAIVDAWAKRDPSRRVSLYATCQTFAHGAGEVEFSNILRDNAARLREGILQGLLPMPYFYDPYYGGSLRKVGEDLVALQRLWGPHARAARTQFPYILSGGGGMCFVEPQEGLKYQMYEVFTTGAVSGGILWNLGGMDGWHWRALAQALHAIARVEDVLWEGTSEDVSCAPAEARVRAVRKGDRSVLLVSHYGYDPVQVSLRYPVGRRSVVTDAETGARVGVLAPGADQLRVAIGRERARLLEVAPEPASRKAPR